MNFILSTDSCCDELRGELEKYGIKVLPLSYYCEEKINCGQFSTEEEYLKFFKEISNGKIFKTSSLNTVEVEEYFKNLLAEGKDIIHISLSSGLSASEKITEDVANKLNETNENQIYVIDSLSATQGQNLILKIALNLRQKQISAERAAELLRHYVGHLDVSFFVSDFDVLKRGGRVHGPQAFIGKLAGIRPILEFDQHGKLKVFQKVIGNKKAILTLFERTKNFDAISGFPFYIAHTGNYSEVTELENLLKKNFPNSEIYKRFIGPVIGSHTGCGALGLAFIGVKEHFENK